MNLSTQNSNVMNRIEISSMTSLLIRFRRCLATLLLLCLVGQAFAERHVRVNFRDADIRSVIESVAELTGKSFVLDPRVKGKVTIISPEAIDSALLYQAVLSAIQVQGFQAVDDGVVTRIVPFNQAFNLATGGGGVELETRLLKVNHVQATNLVPVLKPMLSTGARLQAFAQSNFLVVTDIRANVNQLVSLLKEMDDPENSRVEVISLEHISAAEAVHIAGQLKQLEKQELSLVEDGLNNRVIISGPRMARKSFRLMLKSLDVPSTKQSGVDVIYLDYSRAADIKPVIDGMLQSEMFLRLAGEAGGSEKASTYSVEIDESNNALIIAASSAIIREIKNVVEKLDRSRPQVLIEAVIADLSEDQAKRLSVQIAYANREHGGYLTKFDNLLTTILGTATDGDISEGDVEDIATALGTSDNVLAAAGDFDREDGIGIGVLVQALKTDSATKVLSTPSVVTLDNEEAYLSVGTEVPFLTGSFTTDASGAGNPFQTISREEVGIKLKVKPQISKGDAVRLELDQENSALLGSLGTADVVTAKSTITTNVLVQDGELLVLGGLIDDQFNKGESKVPLLGDIPLLGRLFRSSRKDEDQRVLMMFIRPTILRDENIAREVSERKFDHLITRDLEGSAEGSISVKLEDFKNQEYTNQRRLQEAGQNQGQVSEQ